MTREFIRMPEFEKHWKAIGLTDDDLRELEIFLCLNPQKGDVMEGTGGLRKLRWGLKERGKSGGICVVYVDFAFYEKIYMISAYTKNEQENLTKAQRNEIKRLIQLLENELRRGVDNGYV